VAAAKGADEDADDDASDESSDEEEEEEGAVGPRSSIVRRLNAMATWNNGAKVQPSTIPNAGRGVFATRPFVKGSLVTEFAGESITRDEALVRREQGDHLYIRSLDWNTLVDGVKEPVEGRGLGSLCNDGILPQHNNCVYKRYWHSQYCRYQLVLKATRDIMEGEEFLVSYGRGYWKNALVPESHGNEHTKLGGNVVLDSSYFAGGDDCGFEDPLLDDGVNPLARSATTASAALSMDAASSTAWVSRQQAAQAAALTSSIPARRGGTSCSHM
jgi:hypothetical protein